ncbi:MAG: hypothetical protein WA154_00985 [Moraxellaceae bacterium]
MGSLVPDLVEMADPSNFDFMKEILHCASIVKEIQRPLMVHNGVDKFDPLQVPKFYNNRKNYQGLFCARSIQLAVVGEYDPKIDLVRSFHLTISDLNVDPDGSNASIVEYPECPLVAESVQVPRCFVHLYYGEDLFEAAFEFCLRYLKSKQDKKAVLWVGEVLAEDPFLSYSEVLYLWERFKGTNIEAHEWFVYGWPEIVQMRAVETNH